MNRLSAPLDVQIEVTTACNQKCQHCYNYWRYAPLQAQDELDLSGFSKIITEIHGAGIGQITFTGGEPVLRKDVLLESIRIARLLGIDTGLNSNAVLIDTDCARQLASAGLNHALISFLGPEHIHNMIAGPGGNHERTCRGISALLDKDIPVSVNMVVSKLNIKEIFNTAILAKNLGIKNFCAGPAVPACKQNVSLCLTKEECKICLKELIRIDQELSMNIDILEPLPRCMFSADEEADYVRFFGNRICSAAVSSCAISSTGNIRPCIQADESFGNVLEIGFLCAWNNMSPWASPTILPDNCRSCMALMVCEGGCRMSAKVTSDSYSGADMYMAEPIMDVNRARLMPQLQVSKSISIDDLLKYNERCNIRKEKDGYVAFSNGHVMYLSDSGYRFLERLRTFRNFTIKKLIVDTGYSQESIEPALQRMLRTNILERVTVG
ncbi:MAG: radical SAM protein [Candidatus Taylorbacteria bacterium]